MLKMLLDTAKSVGILHSILEDGISLERHRKKVSGSVTKGSGSEGSCHENMCQSIFIEISNNLVLQNFKQTYISQYNSNSGNCAKNLGSFRFKLESISVSFGFQKQWQLWVPEKEPWIGHQVRILICTSRNIFHFLKIDNCKYKIEISGMVSTYP